MHRRPSTKAFTLAELLITLVVTGILLSALATLAFALSSATAVESDVALVQSQLRHGTVRLQELIRNCRLICAFQSNALAIWEADANADGFINVAELVYVETDPGGDGLRLCWFSSTDNPQITFSSGSLSKTQSELIAGHDEHYIPLMPDCHNVQLTFDSNPPLTRRLTVAFDLTEDDSVHHYQIDMTLRAWAGHLLNAAGDELVTDDDEQ